MEGSAMKDFNVNVIGSVSEYIYSTIERFLNGTETNEINKHTMGSEGYFGRRRFRSLGSIHIRRFLIRSLGTFHIGIRSLGSIRSYRIKEAGSERVTSF